MKKTPFAKFEIFLIAAYCLVLAALSGAYWPTKAGAAQLHAALFSTLFAAAALKLVRPDAFDGFKKIPFVFRFIILCPVALLLAGFAFYGHVAGFGILLIRTFYGGLSMFGIEVALLAILYALARGKKVRFQVARAVFTGIVFSNCLMAVLLYFYLWRPPSIQECERNTGNGYLGRVTPDDFPECMSYPNDIVFLDDLDAVAASFKMAGNLTVEPWNRKEANRFVAISAAPESDHSVYMLPLTGPRLPEWMSWNRKKKTLIITGVGPDTQGFSEIDMSGYPNMRVLNTTDVSFEPNGIAMAPDNSYFEIFGIEKKVAIIDSATGRIIKERAASQIPGGVNILDAYQPEGSGVVYLSMLGPSVVEYDLRTGGTRSADVVFGGGQLVASPARHMLYQSDILFGALNIIDTKTMKLKKRIPLGYKPRAIDLDDKRDLLIIGDWFNGRVHVYRLSTLKEIRDPVPISRYMRGFAYDKKRGILYAAAICGVYRLDLDSILIF